MQKAQTSLKPPEALVEILKKFNLDHPGEPSSEASEQEIPTKQPEPATIVPLEVSSVPSIAPDDDDDNDDYFISKPINSAFEINIAEFPIAYLNRGQLPDGVSKTKYQYKDEIKGRNGEPVERVWTIEAHATEEVKNEVGKNESVNLGFGGPATLELIYELFQLWKEQGFKEPRIHIGTFYNLLKRLGWGTGNTQYKQLKKILRCIHGLHIKGESCFYIPEMDRYLQVDMYPFPSMHTYTKKEKEVNPDDYVYINVDENFFNAIKMNSVYYIPFDRFYFKKLKPMEQKLALMLSKIFSPYRKKQRFEWKRNIIELSNQIPILSEEPNQIRRQLKRVCEGLISKEFPFLSSFNIQGNIITFYNNLQTSIQVMPENDDTKKKDYDTVEWLITEQLRICGDEHSRAFYSLVARYVPVDMIYEALSEAKQEGKVKRKLYTKIIMERGKSYLAPHLKNAKHTEDSVIIPDEEAKRIKLELDKEKEEFEIRRQVFKPEPEELDPEDCKRTEQEIIDGIFPSMSDSEIEQSLK
jgi:hypothetical protein